MSQPTERKVIGTPEAMALWNKIGADMEAEKARWISALRSIGVKAAHPDDGWVERHERKHHHLVQFCYPQFDDGVSVGDDIALGHPHEYRVRRVLEIVEDGWLTKRKRYVVVK